jgi:hypothetical protein
MKNSKPYSEDSFAFYKLVCEKKQSQELKYRLSTMNDEIRLLYIEYDEHFSKNTLESIHPKGYAAQHRADLAVLYDYKMVPFQDLRLELTTTASGRVVKCQHCTINDSNTFDHLVPQSEFVEYSIHPKNLICSCGDCNGRKGTVWRDGGRRTSLNLYLDQLPDIQYLFVELSIGNIRTDVRFFLDNPANAIDAEIYQLICNHYGRLNLCKRFADGADTVITSFKNILGPLRMIPDVAQREAIIVAYIDSERSAFGYNHWQTILKLTLFNDPDFMIDF